MAHERLPVLSSFAHRMTTLRAVLLADTVLLVFFVGRVLVREVGGTFVLPAAAVAGLVLVALENRTVARGVRQALFSPEDVERPSAGYRTALSLYRNRLHVAVAGTLFALVCYSIVFDLAT
jgi:hypothetical protein